MITVQIIISGRQSRTASWFGDSALTWETDTETILKLVVAAFVCTQVSFSKISDHCTQNVIWYILWYMYGSITLDVISAVYITAVYQSVLIDRLYMIIVLEIIMVYIYSYISGISLQCGIGWYIYMYYWSLMIISTYIYWSVNRHMMYTAMYISISMTYLYHQW